MNIINLVANKGAPDDKASYYADSLNLFGLSIDTKLGVFLSSIYVDLSVATGITSYYFVKFVKNKTVVKSAPYIPVALMVVAAVAAYIKEP